LLLLATAAIGGPTMGPYWGRQCHQCGGRHSLPDGIRHALPPLGAHYGPICEQRMPAVWLPPLSSRRHQACNWRDAWRESGSHSPRWHQACTATIGGPLWAYMGAEDASGRLEPEHAKLVCRRIAGGDGGVTRIALAAFVRHYAIV
jgi:hypothetical protein